jgi:hypothetical protein
MSSEVHNLVINKVTAFLQVQEKTRGQRTPEKHLL